MAKEAKQERKRQLQESQIEIQNDAANQKKDRYYKNKKFLAIKDSLRMSYAITMYLRTDVILVSKLLSFRSKS